MKRGFFVFAFVAVFILLSGAVIARPSNGGCPITNDTQIVIYGDTGSGGVGVPSKSWINHFMSWWAGYDSSVKYVFLDRNDVRSDCNLSAYPNVKLYVQPGGNAYYQQNSLGSLGKANILKFIDNNGSYLGICAGAFYASGDYYWQGSYYNWPNLLGRFPTVEGSITSIADYDQSPGYALTGIQANDRAFNMIYYGGPTQGLQYTPTLSVGEQRLSFSSIPGSLPAAVKHNKMLLMSVHAEAYENDGISGLTTEQRIENYKWLARAINDAAGTNYYVPEYAALPACSDASDNDNDGFIDMNDPGCSSVSDNDETDPVGPAPLLFDDFESGSLTGWTLYRASGANNWASVTTNPFEGTRHAQSQPQSTSEPASTMERAVSTVGSSSVSFSYSRRLIGLDIADEFKVKWYDGANWYVLEQTGSGSANDASYISRSFDLPSAAANNAQFKIRFECTAGAVSEFCRIDNVRVAG